jgi:hypothetical protein
MSCRVPIVLCPLHFWLEMHKGCGDVVAAMASSSVENYVCKSDRGSLVALFDAHVDDSVTVNGMRCINDTTFQRCLYRPLTMLFPHLEKYGVQTLCKLLAAGAVRRGDAPHGAAIVKSSKGSGKCPRSVVVFHELVALIWDTIALQIDRHMQIDDAKKQKITSCNTVCKRYVWPASDEEFTRAGRILLEACCLDPDTYLRPTSVEECACEINALCDAAFNAELVDLTVIRDHISPICILELEPSRFLAHVIARSSVMHELVGETLSSRLVRWMHCNMFKIEMHEDPFLTIHMLSRELIRTRNELTTVRHAAATNDHSVLSVVGKCSRIASFTSLPTCTRAQRGTSKGRIDLRLSTVDFALRLNVAFRNVPNTIAASQGLNDLASRGMPIAPAAQCEALDHLVSYAQTQTDVTLFDSALDLLVQQRVAKARLISFAEHESAHCYLDSNMIYIYVYIYIYI